MKKILTTLNVLTIFVAVTGVAQATPVATVPDAGATSSLLVLAFGGLALVRRFVR